MGRNVSAPALGKGLSSGPPDAILPPMTTPNLQARRATIEDLHKLIPLWQQAGLPAEEIGKRLQEFQVVEGDDGAMLAAIGFQIAGKDAQLHTECYSSADQAEGFRALLWQRIQMISKNHGMIRLWTQLEGPFWDQNGFQPAPPDVAAKLPPAFTGAGQPWKFVQLREDVATSPLIEKEFAMFKEMQQAEREQTFQRARRMKVVALIAVLAVFALLLIWAVAWLKTDLRNKH